MTALRTYSSLEKKDDVHGKKMKRIQPFFSSFFYSVLECFGSSSHTLLKERSNNKKTKQSRSTLPRIKELRETTKKESTYSAKEANAQKNLNWNFTINGKRRKLEGWDLKERTHKKKSSSIVLHDETCSFMKKFVPFSNCLFFPCSFLLD